MLSQILNILIRYFNDLVSSIYRTISLSLLYLRFVLNLVFAFLKGSLANSVILFDHDENLSNSLVNDHSKIDHNHAAGDTNE